MAAAISAPPIEYSSICIINKVAKVISMDVQAFKDMYMSKVMAGNKGPEVAAILKVGKPGRYPNGGFVYDSNTVGNMYSACIILALFVGNIDENLPNNAKEEVFSNL